MIGLTQTQDVVAVYDADFLQLFVDARALKATVSETAKVMEHPVESGATITDHRIIDPITIELSIILSSVNYVDTYQRIKSEFLKTNLLTVQTKTGRYPSMIIQAIPHEESPEYFDTITIAISLKQVFLVEAQYGTLPPTKVKSAKNSDTADLGQQSGKETPAKKQSILKGLFGK